jgi:hypothetical protein
MAEIALLSTPMKQLCQPLDNRQLDFLALCWAHEPKMHPGEPALLVSGLTDLVQGLALDLFAKDS